MLNTNSSRGSQYIGLTDSILYHIRIGTKDASMTNFILFCTNHFKISLFQNRSLRRLQIKNDVIYEVSFTFFTCILNTLKKTMFSSTRPTLCDLNLSFKYRVNMYIQNERHVHRQWSHVHFRRVHYNRFLSTFRINPLLILLIMD